jgi:hypothetical protein
VVVVCRRYYARCALIEHVANLERLRGLAYRAEEE